MRRRGLHIVLLISIVLMMLAGALTLRADVTGSILGTVHDRSGAVVAGAQVTVLNVQTNLKQETVSGSDGSFRILALSVGDYKMTVESKGFRNFVETGIVVKVNDQLRLDVT